MKQQDRIEDRVQDIEEQLYKLESDKCLVEVCFRFNRLVQMFSFPIYAQYHICLIRHVCNLCPCKRTRIFDWLLQEKVQHLKEEVQLQYQKMQQLLEEDLGKTLEVLDQAHTKFCQENSTQVLQLNQKLQEAKKLLSSIQMVSDKAEDIKFMRVTKFILGYLCALI